MLVNANDIITQLQYRLMMANRMMESLLQLRNDHFYRHSAKEIRFIKLRTTI